MNHFLKALSLPALLILGGCASGPMEDDARNPTPVGQWTPDKTAVLTALQDKMSAGHEALQAYSPTDLEVFVESMDVDLVFHENHECTMKFKLDMGYAVREITTRARWTMHESTIRLEEFENSTGKVDPFPVYGHFEGDSLEIEKDQMTLVLHRR